MFAADIRQLPGFGIFVTLTERLVGCLQLFRYTGQFFAVLRMSAKVMPLLKSGSQGARRWRCKIFDWEDWKLCKTAEAKNSHIY